MEKLANRASGEPSNLRTASTLTSGFMGPDGSSQSGLRRPGCIVARVVNSPNGSRLMRSGRAIQRRDCTTSGNFSTAHPTWTVSRRPMALLMPSAIFPGSQAR